MSGNGIPVGATGCSIRFGLFLTRFRSIPEKIASILQISVKTVETHRATAHRKLDLRSAADLVRCAIRNRIVEA